MSNIVQLRPKEQKFEAVLYDGQNMSQVFDFYRMRNQFGSRITMEISGDRLLTLYYRDNYEDETLKMKPLQYLLYDGRVFRVISKETLDILYEVIE